MNRDMNQEGQAVFGSLKGVKVVGKRTHATVDGIRVPSRLIMRSPSTARPPSNFSMLIGSLIYYIMCLVPVAYYL